jgi:DNA-binding transcriptional ArsR family regulator
MISMAKLLHEGFREAIEDLRAMKRKIEELPYESSLSKSENTVWKLIREASILSSFGICNEELLKVSSLSLRSISSAVKKLKELGMTEEERIGKYIYRRAVS